MDRSGDRNPCSLALKFRSLSSALAKVGLGEAATSCVRAVAAIVETARVGTGVGSILKELEAVRPVETARDCAARVMTRVSGRGRSDNPAPLPAATRDSAPARFADCSRPPWRATGPPREGVPAAKVVALPRLGCFHHRYEWHSAALVRSLSSFPRVLRSISSSCAEPTTIPTKSVSLGRHRGASEMLLHRAAIDRTRRLVWDRIDQALCRGSAVHRDARKELWRGTAVGLAWRRVRRGDRQFEDQITASFAS